MSEHKFENGDRGVTPAGFRVVWRSVFDGGHDYSAWHYVTSMNKVADHVVIRPLVVIDPEDAGEVERFCEIASRWADDVPYDIKPGDLNHLTAMRGALREFANPKPPKPAEPTGWGAVVVDDEGKRWSRRSDLDRPRAWRDEAGSWVAWSDLAVSSPDQIKFAGVEA